MDLWRGSRKSCAKGSPGWQPVGTDTSKPLSDQESPFRAYASYQAEPDDLETASLPGADDMPAEQEQLTNQAIEEQNQQADQAEPGVLESEPTLTSECSAADFLKIVSNG